MPSFAPARCCSIVRPPGEPEPITAPLAPVPDGTPWLAIAVGAILALGAASIAAGCGSAAASPPLRRNPTRGARIDEAGASMTGRRAEATRVATGHPRDHARG